MATEPFDFIFCFHVRCEKHTTYSFLPQIKCLFLSFWLPKHWPPGISEKSFIFISMAKGICQVFPVFLAQTFFIERKKAHAIFYDQSDDTFYHSIVGNLNFARTKAFDCTSTFILNRWCR